MVIEYIYFKELNIMCIPRIFSKIKKSIFLEYELMWKKYGRIRFWIDDKADTLNSKENGNLIFAIQAISCVIIVSSCVLKQYIDGLFILAIPSGLVLFIFSFTQFFSKCFKSVFLSFLVLMVFHIGYFVSRFIESLDANWSLLIFGFYILFIWMYLFMADKKVSKLSNQIVSATCGLAFTCFAFGFDYFGYSEIPEMIDASNTFQFHFLSLVFVSLLLSIVSEVREYWEEKNNMHYVKFDDYKIGKNKIDDNDDL